MRDITAILLHKETMNQSIQTRIGVLRKRLKKNKVDAILIRSTDQYLNEYVPENRSQRVYFTGFTGSLGDALVTLKDVFLFVDSRYTIQAKNECPHFKVVVIKPGQSIETCWLSKLDELCGKQKQLLLSVSPAQMSVKLYQLLENLASKSPIKLQNDAEELLSEVKQLVGDSQKIQKTPSARPIPISIAGLTTKQKVAQITAALKKQNLDGFAVFTLDDIAWTSNLRGDEFPFQATFGSKALILNNKLYLCLEKEKLSSKLKDSTAQLVPPDKWHRKIVELFSKKACKIGFDPNLTTKAGYQELISAGAKLVALKSPAALLKAVKNSNELQHMSKCFERADKAVFRTQQWVQKQVAKKISVTEADVDLKITSNFKKSGATGLSFRPICGADKNGAIVHYGTPSKKTFLKPKSLFLLDTGAYYEGGYATDLTRTFLAGGPNAKASETQKSLFTAVLKGAIAGMSARFPSGTTGAFLDSIVRNALWQSGLNFGHGTGHGVGINVHEYPPGIRPLDSAILKPGHVFSIEPGLYIENFAGVRIENLCTVVPDPSVSDFLCVAPLTFAPLDERLIKKNILTVAEKSFLKYYKKGFSLKTRTLEYLPPKDNTLTKLLRKKLK